MSTEPTCLQPDDTTDDHRRGMPRGARALLSIVVITYNRADYLLTALRSVARLETGDEFDAEIVVVNNASTDATAQAIEQFSAQCPFPVRSAYESQAGVPFARNRGVSEARGDWICFFDDDQTAEPDWALQLYRIAISEDVGCVGGARDLVIENDLPGPKSEVARRMLGEVAPSQPSNYYHLRWLPNTGNVLIHRTLFEEVGRFDEGTLEGGEDTDFFHRLIKSGRQAAFAPASLVHHHIPAGRVTDEYVQWVAQRHGLVIARRDLLAGPAYAAFSLIARTVQAAFVLFPQWLAYRLRGQKALALGPLCRMRRAQGFAKFILHKLTPPALRGDRALGSFHHRNSAAAASKASGAASSSATSGVTT